MSQASKDVTSLLIQWSSGDREALDRLMPYIYDELRRIAQRQFRRERQANTLQSTALVNEAYLRLINQKGISWQNRAHFFGIAAKIMRQILVDHARARNATKRGGQDFRLDLTEISEVPAKTTNLDVLALDQALAELASFDSQQGRIVELKFFGGLSNDETAEVVGVSSATIKREWGLAKSWLFRKLTN